MKVLLVLVFFIALAPFHELLAQGSCSNLFYLHAKKRLKLKKMTPSQRYVGEYSVYVKSTMENPLAGKVVPLHAVLTPHGWMYFPQDKQHTTNGLYKRYQDEDQKVDTDITGQDLWPHRTDAEIMRGLIEKSKVHYEGPPIADDWTFAEYWPVHLWDMSFESGRDVTGLLFDQFEIKSHWFRHHAQLDLRTFMRERGFVFPDSIMEKATRNFVMGSAAHRFVTDEEIWAYAVSLIDPNGEFVEEAYARMNAIWEESASVRGENISTDE